MVVGELVKHYTGSIFEYCDMVSHDEIDLLMDARFSKRTLGLHFAFCKLATEIDDSEHKRYWTRIYVVRGKAVRVTSQWFDKNRAPFGAYLMACGIAKEDEIREFEESPADREKAIAVISSRVDARYRGNAIGNAQNPCVDTDSRGRRFAALSPPRLPPSRGERLSQPRAFSDVRSAPPETLAAHNAAVDLQLGHEG